MDAKKLERMRAAQMKDVAEMQAIYEGAAAGLNPDEACQKVLGSTFQLSTAIAGQIAARGAEECRAG